MALNPHLVNMSKAVNEKPHQPPISGKGVVFASDTVDETGCGVFGTQTTASEERGKEVFAVAVDALIVHVRQFRETSQRANSKGQDLRIGTRING